MYEVNFNARTSYVSNYFYCRKRPDAEHDLLAVAKFLVS